MNKNQRIARTELFKQITVKCKECGSSMIQVIDLYDQAIVGYSCQNCPHYYLYHV